MTKRILALAVLAAAVVASGSAAAARQGGAAVTLHKTKLGKVLATSKGRTLYMYSPDGHNKSNCYGACSGVWPPLLTSGKPIAGKGVKASLLGVTKRKDGKHQVTYAGHPLYSYTGDTGEGQTTGQGYDQTWYVLNSSGKRVTQSSGGGGGGGGGGYGGGGYGNGGY